MLRDKELTKTLTIRLSPDQYRKLSEYSQKKGCKISSLFRHLLDGYVQELERIGELNG